MMEMGRDLSEPPVALVLGATGGVGGHVAARLSEQGWRVRALHRRARGQAAKGDGYDWVQGDAMHAADVLRAASGADLIVHAVNPPGYRDWQALVLPMLDNTIAAAMVTKACILFPGTVYNFGPDVLPNPVEESPQNPATVKGRIRAEMERRLEAAAQDDVQVIIVRAGDFFGPAAGNSWFSQSLVKPGRRVDSVTLPNARGVGHQWAYLPDVAEVMVQLVAKRRALPRFARYHMQGHWDGDGFGMVEAIERLTGARIRRKRMPWWFLKLASPFVPMFREVLELRYLWESPLRMDNARLVEALGVEPRTPLDVAVRATLADLGCLPNAADREAALRAV